MTVTAAAGTVAVPLQAGQGAAACVWDANEVVTLANATHPAGQSRIDLVIVQVRDNALDAGANNDFIVTSVTGVPAASNPAVPALPTNALAIAQVLVPGAVANLSTATVTDLRGVGLSMPRPGELVGYKHLSGVNLTATTGSFTVLDAVNGVVRFVVPPSGRVQLSVVGQFINGAAGVQALVAWSSQPTSNANLITASATTGNLDGSRFTTIENYVTGVLTPGAVMSAWLQMAYTAAAGSVAVGNGADVSFKAIALP
jgi:hypothetical protein